MGIITILSDDPGFDGALGAGERGAAYAIGTDHETKCFYCYSAITVPAVIWSGATGEIVLHPKCVIELFLRMGRDVWEIECTWKAYVTDEQTFR